jgi:hypothetical protein
MNMKPTEPPVEKLSLAALRRFIECYSLLWATGGISIRDVPNRFLELSERHWKKWEEPRLHTLRLAQAAATDPAHVRGDELELFRSHHEEDYSNWLAWLFSPSSPAHRILQPTLLHEVCGVPIRHGAFDIFREVPVDEGFDGHPGYLDLLLKNKGSRTVVVIENKTRNPSLDELGKHPGYARSIRAKYPGWNHHFVLLVPHAAAVPTDRKDDGFRVCEWSTLSRALRLTLARRQLSAYPDVEVLVRLFVGAIESYVLDYPVAAWRHVLTASCPDPIEVHVVTASRYLDYLEETNACTDE